MKKITAICLVFAFLFTCFLSSCSFAVSPDPGPSGGGDTTSTYRVMVPEGDHFTVTTQNPVEVEEGATATFTIEIESGYIFKSSSAGIYNPETKVLTINNVTDRISVDFEVTELGYDPNQEFTFFFSAEDGDTSSVLDGAKVKAGTLITVTSHFTGKIFAGWSLNGTSSDYVTGIVSTDVEYCFTALPDIAVNDVIEVYANYRASNALVYNANGGSIDSSVYSKRVANNTNYYFATKTEDTISLLYTAKALSMMECYSTFWDSGLFVRDGYTLKEYNTKADGTGTSYSLGSKIYGQAPENGTLFCIWSKWTRDSFFNYENKTMSNPALNASYQPNWVSNGIIITNYRGTAETVTIPDQIDGKTVIGIAAGAFRNQDTMTGLVLNRHMQIIEDGAFVGCTNLSTIYYPDSIYTISDDSFDAATLSSIHHLYVNATMAPRYTGTNEGAFAVKLSRLLASENENRIIVIGGSSSYQGLSTPYLQKLLDNDYRVINFGTTRTTNGLLYLEAMTNYAHEGDIVLLAPENSIYMMGETTLYWKTLRDLEGMYNIYRYVDIANYTDVFDSFADFNQNYRYKQAEKTYENLTKLVTSTVITDSTDIYGDKQATNRNLYSTQKGAQGYTDSYFISMNEYYKSINDGAWNSAEQQAINKDYTNPNNKTWIRLDSERITTPLNKVLDQVKETGAKVYFSFAPVDANAINEEARNLTWLQKYDAFLLDTFHFDGLVGASCDYVWAHEYFYDCAYHLNDYGRTYRTYQLYKDLCEILDIDVQYITPNATGASFTGVIFENTPDNLPKYKVSWLTK